MAHFKYRKKLPGWGFCLLAGQWCFKFLYKFTICGASVISNIYGHIENKKLKFLNNRLVY